MLGLLQIAMSLREYWDVLEGTISMYLDPRTIELDLCLRFQGLPNHALCSVHYFCGGGSEIPRVPC